MQKSKDIIERIYYYRGCVLVFVMLLTLVSCNYNRKDKKVDNSGPETGISDSITILDSLVNVFRIIDPQIAMSSAIKAVRLAESSGNAYDSVRAFFAAGKAFNSKKADTAFVFYKQALKISDSLKFMQLQPKIHYNLAMLYKLAGSYKEALFEMKRSLEIAKTINDFVSVANSCNTLGNFETEMDHREKANELFRESLKVAEEHNLNRQIGVAYGSLALMEPDVSKAMEIQRKAISYLIKENGAFEDIAYVFINIGNMFTIPDSAIMYYNKAVSIAKQTGDYEILLSAFNNMAYSYLDLNDIRNAEVCLRDKGIPLAEMKHNLNWLPTLYDSYADVLKRKGDFRKSQYFQKQAMIIKAEADRKNAKDQLRLLSAMLDAANRELTIKNQSEIIQAKNRDLLIKTIEITVILLLMVAVVLILTWKIQRKNLRFKTIEIETTSKLAFMEQQENERLSMKLHSAARPLKTVLIKQLEEINFPDQAGKSLVMDQVDLLASGLRRISHLMNPAFREQQSIKELIRSLKEDFEATSPIRMVIDMTEEEIRLDVISKENLYFILHELLTNAEKHSKAGQITLTLEHKLGNVYLFYEDDGQGFNSENEELKGIGIRHIFNRMEFIKGKAELITAPGEGTKWMFVVPFSKHDSRKWKK